jgi:hypothetical protein
MSAALCPIMRPTGRDRQAVGIDQRVDPGRQAAARTAHATGSPLFIAIGAVLVNPDRDGPLAASGRSGSRTS